MGRQKKPHLEGGGFWKISELWLLPLLRAGVAEVGLETKFGWELGESVARVHLDSVISAAAGVRWLEGAVMSWAVEGHELVDAVADPLESAARAVNNTV